MSAQVDHCPHCGTSLLGDPIPDTPHRADCEEQKDRMEKMLGRRVCHCKPYGDATHFRREMGHEVSGVYDGILFWSCPDCGLAWPRWTDGAGRLTDAAAGHVAAWNEAVAKVVAS